MILRATALAAGLVTATTASQFPEFSQQYTQRLGGAVQALEEVVADFDASAAAEGLSRAQALDQMRGTDFVERRRADMQATFARYDQLRADLTLLEGQGPFMRAYHAARMSDRDISRSALQAFEPAVPLTFAGVVFSVFGFVLGWISVRVLGALARLPFRRVAG